MISLLHPSRNRPNQAYAAYVNWIAQSKNEVEHILCVDKSDIELPIYMELFRKSKIVLSDGDCAVDAVNAGAKRATGNILMFMADDFDCFKDWDVSVESAMVKKGMVLKTFDSIQKWIVTLTIMDREYYEMNGYYYYPEYRHMFCDTDLTHKADIEGRLVFRNDITFKHKHYTRGETKKDALNERADKTWKQGEEIYLKRCRNKFGTDKSIWDISNEGIEHKQWLKQRLS